jgi:two-component system, LytTR family, response regulator
MIRTALADDDVSARHQLRRLLAEIDDVEVLGETATTSETIDLVHLTRPELLFLATRLADKTGFDVIEALSPGRTRTLPYVVLVSFEEKEAVRAFEVRAVDYLLKPLTRERLHAAVQRVRERLRQIQSDRNELAITSRQDGPLNQIVFKSRDRLLLVRELDIRWISAEENYVRINTASEKHFFRETMTSLQQRLDPNVFLRIHRSAIVNLHHVREIKNEANGEATVLLDTGDRVRMSRSCRSRIQTLLRS